MASEHAEITLHDSVSVLSFLSSYGGLAVAPPPGDQSLKGPSAEGEGEGLARSGVAAALTFLSEMVQPSSSTGGTV